MPVSCVSNEISSHSRDNKARIFANDDGSHVVAINETQQKFKIMLGDMVFLQTDWLDARNNYETNAQPFWKR